MPGRDYTRLTDQIAADLKSRHQNSGRAHICQSYEEPGKNPSVFCAEGNRGTNLIYGGPASRGGNEPEEIIAVTDRYSDYGREAPDVVNLYNQEVPVDIDLVNGDVQLTNVGNARVFGDMNRIIADNSILEVMKPQGNNSIWARDSHIGIPRGNYVQENLNSRMEIR